MKFLFALLFAVFANVAVAAPQNYVIDAENSDIGFIYKFGQAENRGEFPDFDIDLKIDFANLASSEVFVVLDTRTATAGFVFATQALRSKKVLSAKEFPEISFRSKSVRGAGTKAVINGNITIKGTTKPLSLNAQLFRPKGTAPDELDNLIMRITGTVNRFDFGASGFSNEVGPDLKIDITAAIKAVN